MKVSDFLESNKKSVNTYIKEFDEMFKSDNEIKSLMFDNKNFVKKLNCFRFFNFDKLKDNVSKNLKLDKNSDSINCIVYRDIDKIDYKKDENKVINKIHYKYYVVNNNKLYSFDNLFKCELKHLENDTEIKNKIQKAFDRLEYSINFFEDKKNRTNDLSVKDIKNDILIRTKVEKSNSKEKSYER